MHEQTKITFNFYTVGRGLAEFMRIEILDNRLQGEVRHRMYGCVILVTLLFLLCFVVFFWFFFSLSPLHFPYILC